VLPTVPYHLPRFAELPGIFPLPLWTALVWFG
jgi:hypothetical protein